MKILAYRMFFHGEFCAALKACGNNIVFFSSERRMDETGVISRFYSRGDEANIADHVLTDVVIRCRYLSSLNLLEARKIVRKMWAAVDWYFDFCDVSLVISPAVDNFVTDICFRVASRETSPRSSLEDHRFRTLFE